MLQMTQKIQEPTKNGGCLHNLADSPPLGKLEEQNPNHLADVTYINHLMSIPPLL